MFMLHKLHLLHTSLHSISNISTIECKEARNSRKLFLGLRAAETLHDYFCVDSLRRCEYIHTALYSYVFTIFIYENKKCGPWVNFNFGRHFSVIPTHAQRSTTQCACGYCHIRLSVLRYRSNEEPTNTDPDTLPNDPFAFFIIFVARLFSI